MLAALHALCSLLLLVLREDDEEFLEEDNCVQVEIKRFVNRIPCWLLLCIVNELLNIIKSKGAEQKKSTIEPNVE